VDSRSRSFPGAATLPVGAHPPRGVVPARQRVLPARQRRGLRGGPGRADHPCMRVRGGSGAAASVSPAGLRPMHPTAARELPADQTAWAFERGAAVAYLVFDLLWLDGRLLTGLPHVERRRRLEELEVAGPAWQTVASFPGTGTVLLAATGEQGLEGVVAKRLQRTYLPGRRTRNWLKTKHYQREPFLGRAASSPTATRSGRCSSASPTRGGRGGCAWPAGSTTGWSRRPGGGSGSCWARWWSTGARSPSPRRPWSGTAGPGPAPTTAPGVRPPRGGRRGHLPRLGVGPATAPCLQRPEPATVGVRHPGRSP
jgi:hypothetical protein